MEAIFSSGGVTAYCNAYTLLSSVVEILMLKRWLDGRKPDEVVRSKDGTQVTLIQNNQQITINYFAFEGFNSPTVNAACSRIAEPLRGEGIDSVMISDADKAIEATFSKEDLEAICAAAPEKILTSNVSRSIVMIETAAFKDKAKWRVKIGEGASVFASISDKAFLADIDAGRERFGKGDVLLVELESTQMLSNGKLIIKHDIKKVLQHRTSAEQLTLPSLSPQRSVFACFALSRRLRPQLFL